MPLITSAGVASGLDLESIIRASVDAADTPKRQIFVEKDTRLHVELSGVGAVKSALSSLDEIITKLADIDNFTKRAATITQPSSGDIISVSTTSNSTPGNFDIEVMQLAEGSRAVSTPLDFTSPTDVVTATGGNLTLSAGTESFAVAIDPGATLEDVRNAINDATDNFGVSVNIINTGGASPESKLVITSSETGAGNDLTITNDIAELDKVSTTAFGGGAGGLVIAAADVAKDAIIEVDKIQVNSATNKFSDAIQDMTITAVKVSENNETASINVDTDKDGVTKLIDEFIGAFNNTISTIDSLTRPGGALSGDSAMKALKGQLIDTLSTEITGAGDLKSIFDLGLGLSVEKVAGNTVTSIEKTSIVRSLSDALGEFYTEAGQAFAGTGGIATQFESLLNNYLDTDGALKFREDSLNSEIRQLEDDVANHEYRMEQLELRLRNQYTALDGLVANLRSSGNYLTQQLASLPGFTKPSSSN